MPRADFVSQFVLPKVAGPFSVCPELMADRTPVTARANLPAIVDLSAAPQLASLGVSLTSAGGSILVCLAPGADGSSMSGRALKAILGPQAGGGALAMSPPKTDPSGYDLPRPALLGGLLGASAGPIGGDPSPGGSSSGAQAAPKPAELHVYRLEAAEPGVVAKALEPMCARAACSITPVEGQPELLALMQPGMWPELKTAILDLDQEPRSYMVRGLVFEADDTTADQLGVSFDIGRNVFASTNSVATSNETKLGLSFAGAAVAINAQADRGKASVISRPTLRVLDGELASFESSTAEPIVSQVVRDPTGLTTQGVTYIDAGVILGVTVTASGSLARVTLKQELSSFGTALGVAGDPSKVKRVMSSTFVVPFGRPILLGGLTRSAADQARSRLPFLGLPTGKTASTSSERVYMLLQLDQEPAELAMAGDARPRPGARPATAGGAAGELVHPID